jgi:hypothetical protein
MKFVIGPDKGYFWIKPCFLIKIFIKIFFGSKEPSWSGILDWLPSGGFFIRGQTANTPPSTGWIVILPGITSSLTRNLPEEWFFRQEIPAQGQEIHPKNGIPLGITNSWKLIQTGEIKMHEKSSKW